MATRRTTAPGAICARSSSMAVLQIAELDDAEERGGLLGPE
jgi:hypothetical protein